jgi:hypothetical protein
MKGCFPTGVLRDHIVKGYSVNARRLDELQQSLKLIGQVLERYDVTSDQAKGLLAAVTDYAAALDLLDNYDHQRVSIPSLKPQPAKGIDYDEAMNIVAELRRKVDGSDVSGKEKDRSLQGSLGNVMQTFDGKDLYPTRVTCAFKGKRGQIVLDQIRTIDKTRLMKKLGVIDPKTQSGVISVLQRLFAF